MRAVSDRVDAGRLDVPAANPAESGRISLAREAPVRLGGLRIEPALRRVANDNGGEAILEPRVMQVLVALIRADGAIVSRDELMLSCWHGVVVGEDALNRVIGRLRRLLDGLGDGGFQVETVSRVGYRLVSSAPEPRAAPAADTRPSICVLPFANMSDDPQQAYFSDGVTEDIITDLSKVRSLFVVARTTAFTFRDRGLDVPEVARQLNVGHILEGSVRKADGRVRITAQLIDGASGGHVWAERYDRDLKDIFAVQDEISKAIVAALKLRLLPEEEQAIEQRETKSAEAYSLYLMARRYHRGNREGQLTGLEAIARLCARAVEIDPDYARAWTLLATAQMTLSCTYGRDPEVARIAIDRALALDPDLAEAHALRARYLGQDGRFDEAAEEIDIALGLDPESWTVNSEAGRMNYNQGRFAEAIGHWEKAMTMDGSCSGDPGMLMSSYRAVGDAEGVRRSARIALARAEQALAQEHINASAMGFGVGALAALGELARARDWIDRGLLIDPDNLTTRYNFACAMSAYGADADSAIALLEPVFAAMTAPWLNQVKADRDLDPVRADPRFAALLAAAEHRLAGAATPLP